MKCTDKRLRLCKALLIGILVFIWGNSLLPGEASGALSDWFKSLLYLLFRRNPQTNAGVDLIRKLAHFSEFTVLGICLAWLHGMLQKGKLQPFLWGVLAASADETIQRFVPDRGPSIRDVCIDSAGVLTGIILLWMGYHYLKKRSANETLEDK